MPTLASRVSTMAASGIRRIFDLAATLPAPVDLSIGQPDFDVPDPVKDAAVAAIRGGRNAYSPTQGAKDLLDRLRAHLNPPGEPERYGAKQILATGAVSGGLALGYMALLDPGDEIIVPDPYFVIYKQMALLLDAKPVFLDTYPDFRLDPDRLARLVTPRTKAIVVGSPSNPTGSVYSRAELDAVARLARERDFTIIADEIYSAYCYDAPFASLADLAPERTLRLDGWSKSHAMTGWRVGWAAGPEDLIQAMAKLQQYTFVCAPTPAQAAAVVALDAPTDAVRDDYRRRRDLVADGLADAGYRLVRPGGAFYAFAETPWGTDESFVEACIRRNLLVIPGGVFSERKTHFRIAYAQPEATIRDGLRILKELRAGEGA